MEMCISGCVVLLYARGAEETGHPLPAVACINLVCRQCCSGHLQLEAALTRTITWSFPNPPRSMNGGRCSDSPARQPRLHLGTCTFNPCTWKVGPQIGLARVQFSFLNLMLCVLGCGGAWHMVSPPAFATCSELNIGKNANIDRDRKLADCLACCWKPSIPVTHPQIHHHNHRTDRIRNLLGPDPPLCPSDFPWLGA